MHAFEPGEETRLPRENPELWAEHANSIYTVEIGIKPQVQDYTTMFL